MPELGVLHVVRRGALPRGLARHLIRRHVDELGLFVDELLDEPRARDPIHAWVLAGDPLHRLPPRSGLSPDTGGVNSNASPAAAVHDLRRGALADDLQRRRWPVLGGLVPDGDRPDRGELRWNDERLAERSLVEDPEEHRPEARVDRGLEDEQRGHPGVDIPVRRWPALLVLVRPAFVRQAVPRQVLALVRQADDERRRVEHPRPPELLSPFRGHRGVPVPLGLVLTAEDEERPALAEAGGRGALGVRDDPVEDFLIDRPVLERAHHPPLADDVLEFHAPTMYEWRSPRACRSSR